MSPGCAIDRPVRARAGGASLLEFLVAGTVVLVLAGMLMARLAHYRDRAEQAAVQRMVAVLETALAIRAAASMDQAGAVARLAGQNPMRWLAQPPANYLGELLTPELASMPKGHWYFDRKRHLLVYLLNFPEKFPQGIPNARYYQVKLIRRNNSFARPTGTPAHGGIALIQVDG